MNAEAEEMHPFLWMTVQPAGMAEPGEGGRIEVEICLNGAVARRIPVWLDARAALWLAAAGIEAAGELLRRVHGALPEPPERMLLYEVPYDVDAETRGTVETVLDQELGPVVERLRATATVTPEQLRSDWEEHRRDSPREGIALPGEGALPPGEGKRP